VSFLGCLPQQTSGRVDFIAAAVVPSLWQEPLGLVVLEALACGLAVIASAVGGNPEMIEDGKTSACSCKEVIRSDCVPLPAGIGTPQEETRWTNAAHRWAVLPSSCHPLFCIARSDTRFQGIRNPLTDHLLHEHACFWPSSIISGFHPRRSQWPGSPHASASNTTSPSGSCQSEARPLGTWNPHVPKFCLGKGTLKKLRISGGIVFCTNSSSQFEKGPRRAMINLVAAFAFPWPQRRIQRPFSVTRPAEVDESVTGKPWWWRWKNNGGSQAPPITSNPAARQFRPLPWQQRTGGEYALPRPLHSSRTIHVTLIPQETWCPCRGRGCGRVCRISCWRCQQIRAMDWCDWLSATRANHGGIPRVPTFPRRPIAIAPQLGGPDFIQGKFRRDASPARMSVRDRKVGSLVVIPKGSGRLAETTSTRWPSSVRASVQRAKRRGRASPARSHVELWKKRILCRPLLGNAAALGSDFPGQGIIISFISSCRYLNSPRVRMWASIKFFILVLMSAVFENSWSKTNCPTTF